MNIDTRLSVAPSHAQHSAPQPASSAAAPTPVVNPRADAPNLREREEREATQQIVQSEKEAQANQRRIALAEKMIGANKSLIIEKDADRVGFVYKTIDKATGEVVRVWPQREVASALKALSDKDANSIMAGMLLDERV